MATARIEPLDFFTMDSLKAGWYLTWRLWLRLFAIFFVGGIIVAVATVALGGRQARMLTMTGVIILGAVAAIAVSIHQTNKIAGQWTMKRYGRELTQGVWWGITWRTFLVAIAMNVGTVIVQLLFRGTFEVVANTVSFVLGIASIVLSLQACGWAMSTIVADRLQGFEADVPAEPLVDSGADPVDPMDQTSREPVAQSPETVPDASATGAFRPARPQAQTAASGAVQCPKCGQYETELGTIIGRYCRICGWRASRG